MLNNLGLVSNLVNSELITENSLKTGQDKKKRKESLKRLKEDWEK